jgi:hypothetical protein
VGKCCGPPTPGAAQNSTTVTLIVK